ncbi:MAG: biotin-dependent carboxyltransferase family protein [Chitinophagaceae bacterium]|nr:biotin-dependent carboxyltransferase family protein [Chitinophagaceae bacterium]
MALCILKSGLLDTIQDAGRYGFQHWGVNPGGAMDTVAMQVANMLVDNPPAAPVIEMHFPAAEINFEEPTIFSLAGADFGATLNGQELAVHHPVIAAAGSVLKFVRQVSGCRVYLAVRGGFAADAWLNSYSTHLKAGAGGHGGRALQKNDRIAYRNTIALSGRPSQALPWLANLSGLYIESSFWFLPGAEYDFLDAASKTQLQEACFSINRKSDRMGYRLQGAALHSNMSGELISTAVTRGTMQLLPDGQLIILMADHQTTGGYPRIGHVITAHQPSLSQMRPGEDMRFVRTDIAAAERLFLSQQRNLQQLQNACTFRLQEYLVSIRNS